MYSNMAKKQQLNLIINLKMVTLALLFVLTIAGIEAGKHDIYTGNKLFKVQLRDIKDSLLLEKLEVALDLDIWQHGSPEQREAVVRTTPQNEKAMIEELEKQGIVYKVKLDDLPGALEKFDAQMFYYRRTRTVRQPFEDYPRYDEIDAYMERLAADYPNLVTVVNAGNSFEGRPVKYLKISTTSFNDESKPIIFMEAMLHAREWVTTPVTLYAMHRLLEDLSTEDQDLLEDIDWIILPVANPDGYEYSHTDERFWRKTRSVRPEVSDCVGVDANRNFDSSFNTVGVSQNPCSEVYPGPEAFSELETGYVRDILAEHINRIQVFFDIHSFGNYILFPYGNATLAPNSVVLHHMAALMGAEMDLSKLNETDYYLIGNSGLLLYPTSGAADDYAQEFGVPFSFCLELPGYETGFIVSPQYIPHFTEETWRGIVAGARLAKMHYRGPYSVRNH